MKMRAQKREVQLKMTREERQREDEVIAKANQEVVVM